METIAFNCRFITPAFLGGANPKGTPELRAPSIKGALRFWWRAMKGHLVQADDNGKPTFQSLLKNDELLFGGINQVKQKSPLTIRVVERDMRYTKGGDIFRGNQIEGIEYLFYSLKRYRKDDLGFDSCSKFEVIFSCREGNRDVLLKALASFWLLVNLGSLGTRARRCAGAFCIDSIEDEKGILKNQFSFFPESTETTITFLNSNFTKIKRLIGATDPILFKEYSLLNQEAPAYLSKSTFKTWQEAVNDIGNEMRTIRKGKTSPIKANRTFTMETLDKKAAFGISVGVFSDNSVTFEENKRRASPIYLSVVFNKNTQKFHWIVTHLEGAFMPNDDKIVFTSKNRNVRIKNFNWSHEDDSLLKSFMNKIKTKAQKI